MYDHDYYRCRSCWDDCNLVYLSRNLPRVEGLEGRRLGLDYKFAEAYGIAAVDLRCQKKMFEPLENLSPDLTGFAEYYREHGDEKVTIKNLKLRWCVGDWFTDF